MESDFKSDKPVDRGIYVAFNKALLKRHGNRLVQQCELEAIRSHLAEAEAIYEAAARVPAAESNQPAEQEA